MKKKLFLVLLFLATFLTGSAQQEWNFGNEMNYCGDSEFINAWGSPGNAVSWAVMYPASLMGGRNQVEKVRMYFLSQFSGNYTLTLYEDGTDTPQTQIYTHTYLLDSAADGWVDLPMMSTVTLDTTKSLWVVMHTGNEISFPMCYTEYCGDPNSCLFLYNEQWTPLFQVPGGRHQTWMLYAVTSPSTTTGIAIQSNPSLLIFPNPTTGFVTIVAEELLKTELHDINGRLLFSTTSPDIDLSDFSSGVYLLRVITRSGIISRRIVKK